MYTRLYETGVDANVNDGETEDDDDHDVLRILPEHILLAEQVLMSQPEQKEAKTENLNQNLAKSSAIKILYVKLLGKLTGAQNLSLANC